MTVDDARRLAFAAWQESRGLASLDQQGESWIKFLEWWRQTTRASEARQLTVEQLCLLAWGAAQVSRFRVWWGSLPP